MMFSLSPILMLMSTKKLILILAAAFLALSIIFICLMIWTKGIARGLIFFLGFVVFFIGIYVAGYNYFYEYPQGYLDVIEREDEALNYWDVRIENLDSDNVIYFTRSNNGSGKDFHVGIVYSKMPKYINHFFCEGTSSAYGEVGDLIYDISTDGNFSYLAGVVNEKGISKIVVTFELGNDQTKSYEGTASNGCFYILNFDEYHASKICKVEGFNSSDSLIFTRYYDSLEKGKGNHPVIRKEK